MPRRPRIRIDGLPLHIVQRGHNRDACFFAEEDHHTYLHWLGEALKTHGGQLHAYVMMTNHVHLLLTPGRAADVPALMVSLGRRFVQYINRVYRRTSTLWDSRYKASVVQSDNYLLTCQRYIELNPVRAGMVNDPAQYRWSSYRTHGLGAASALLAPHPAYLALGADAVQRQTAYRALFRAALDETAIADIRLALNQNQPLGDARFLAQIAQATGQRRQAQPRGRPRKAGGNGDGATGEQQELNL